MVNLIGRTSSEKKFLCGEAEWRRMSRLQEALLVGPQIPSTRIPGLRQGTAEANGETCRPQSRQHFWSAAVEHAGDAHRFPVRPVWDDIAIDSRTRRTMSQVWVRTPFLQAVRALRSLKPVRMQPADSRTDLSER